MFGTHGCLYSMLCAGQAIELPFCAKRRSLQLVPQELHLRGWNQVVGQREKFDVFLQTVKEEKYPQRRFIGTRKGENHQEMLLSNNVIMKLFSQKFSENKLQTDLDLDKASLSLQEKFFKRVFGINTNTRYESMSRELFKYARSVKEEVEIPNSYDQLLKMYEEGDVEACKVEGMYRKSRFTSLS